MGLLSGVLFLPLAPVRGVGWVAERLLDAAERELCDPAAVRARLGELNRAYEEGEIGTADFEREEERLLDLLEPRPPAAVTGAHARVRSTTTSTTSTDSTDAEPAQGNQP